MKKIVALSIICLILSMNWVKAQDIPGGGTSADPYRISTVAQLEKFRDEVNAGDYKTGKVYKLTNDLDLVQIPNWVPIAGFDGTFLGDKHSINNLTITGDLESQGLFSNTGGRMVIKNVILNNANVSGGYLVGCISSNFSGRMEECAVINSKVNGIGYVGLLIGTSGTPIYRCYGQGEISAVTHAGGIAGQSDRFIIDCYADVIIKNNNYLYTSGGITGLSTEFVQSCYSKGSIKGKKGNTMGGINGFLSGGNIINCVSLMTSILTEEPQKPENWRISESRRDNSVMNCYAYKDMLVNDTKITSTNPKSPNGADITLAQAKTQSFWQNTVGFNFDSIWKMNTDGDGYPMLQWMPDFEPEGPFARGNGSEENPYQITQPRYLDSLINHASEPGNEGTHYRIMNDIDMLDYILENYPVVGWRGNDLTEFNGYLHGGGHVIKGIWMNRSTSTMAGGLFAGTGVDGTIDSLGVHLYDRGIIASGKVGGLVGANQGIIFSCYTQSNMVKNVSTNATGGLVGHNTGEIFDCYSTCNIITQGSTQGFTGGLVGFNDNRYANIGTSYSTGNITNASSDIAGGIVGKNDKGYVRFCYFDKQTSMKTSAAGYTNSAANVKVNALTTAQMKTQDVLVYFDYDGIWKTIPNSYPMLQWQKTETAPKRLVRENNNVSQSTSNEIVVYPNPTTGIVNIEMEGDLKIKIYNMQGLLLKETNNKTIDLSSYSKGIYIFDINGKHKKIVKN